MAMYGLLINLHSNTVYFNDCERSEHRERLGLQDI